MSGNKRAASPTNAAEGVPAQRMRLAATEAAPADQPSDVRPLLSAAQRCAADSLALLFGFVGLKELARAVQTCRAWLATAAKDQPRGLTRAFDQANQLAAVCVSSSPFRRHIACITVGEWCSLSVDRLAQLRHLPNLTGLKAHLSWLNEKGERALADLKAAFPPHLRELHLNLTDDHTTAARQLLLNALPAMQEQESDTALISALSACPALTDLTVQWESCSEPFRSRLMQAVPRLRTLRFEGCSLPALRVLRHVPRLKELSLIKCPDMHAGHVVGLGAFVPRLESLTLEECDSPLLDKDERQLLTPPGALGLPRLREFNYRPSSV